MSGAAELADMPGIAPGTPLATTLATLAARGVELGFEGDRLRFRAPKGALDPHDRALLSSQREGVIAALRQAAARRVEEYPVSAAQTAIWFTQLQAPASAVCTIGFALGATGRLDLGALRHVIQALVDRHAALRTTYHLTDKGLVQRVAGAATAGLVVHRFTGADADGPFDHWAREAIGTGIARPFDLQAGPILRASLFTDDAEAHVVLLTVHHIAADDWSVRLLMTELLQLYGDAADDRPAGLARPTATYADFVRWQRQQIGGAAGERHWSYWRGVLAAPRQRTILPGDVTPPAVRSFAGGAIRFDLQPDMAQQVRALAAQHRTTPFVVMLGGFQLLLARLCGVGDVLTGITVLGRPKPEFFAVVGDFVNVLPLRSRVDEAATVSDFLARLHETVLGALEAQDYPLARIVERLHPAREATGQTLFNTCFTMLANDGRPDACEPDGTALGGVPSRTIAGTNFALHPLIFQAGLFDLSLDVFAGAGVLQCILKYSADVFTEAAARRIASQYGAMVLGMTEAPGGTLAGLAGQAGDRDSGGARAAALLASLAARDIRLTLDAGRVRVSTPKGALGAADRQSIADLRSDIVALLRDGGTETGALGVWRSYLDGAPAALALPTDRPRADRRDQAVPTPRPGFVSREVSVVVLDRLEKLGEAGNAPLFTVLLAAWMVLLHRYCGQDDLLVATRTSDARCPGETKPLRSRVAGNPAFNIFVDQVRQTILAVAGRPVPPPDALAAALGREPGATLCQARFDLLTGSAAREPRQDAFDLALDVMPPAEGEHPENWRFRYGFAPDLFDPDTIARLHENFVTLIESIAADLACPILDLNLLGPAEEERRPRDTGGTPLLQHDPEICVHQLFEMSARRHPERIAITGPGGTLRYEALDRRANRLACFLMRAGVRPGSLVAVCLDRTVDVPVALAAVLKVGGAYIPLDPAHPADRQRDILRDSGAICLVTQSGMDGIVDGTAARVIRLDTDAAEIGAFPDAAPDVPVRPDDLAYVIYTSGSTGRPKGVEVEHRNVVAFLAAMRQEPGLTDEDVLLAVTTFSFDIAGLDIWLPLSVGARIVLAARADALDGARLATMLDAHAISVMQATPATWHMLLESGWAGRADLRALCGGEAMPLALAARLAGRVGALWNMYGPTETTIWSTAFRVTAAATGAGGNVPVGRPIAGTTVHVLDHAGHPVPAGVVGELAIGGAGVARGYRGQEALTARSFVTHTLRGATARLYHTGDLVRFRDDGQLDFVGRRDHQIKLRGHRIETGEIEAVLAGQAGIAASVVTLRGAASGGGQLVAYVTLAPGAAFDQEAARATLRARLPGHMVPAHIVVLPRFPLTPNGKVDRAALPAPEDVPGALAAPAGPAAPMTEAQQCVAALWREVLRRERIGLHDNFFDLGGHSLLLVKLQAGLQRAFAADIPLIEFFHYTTVAQQAGRLSAARCGAPCVSRRARAEADTQRHD